MILFCICIVMSYGCYATNLFDSNRGRTIPKKTVVIKKTPTKVPLKKVSLKLIAISRMVGKYHLTFKEKNKKELVKYVWKISDKPLKSPLHGFYIYNVAVHRVQFKAFNGNSFYCQENKELKVTCNKQEKIISYGIVSKNFNQAIKRQ